MTLSPSASPQLQPFFLDGIQGKVYCTYFPAIGNTKGAWLYLPPFGEEMNRCRATVAAQARALAEQGHGVLLLDPYGTGDSEGDFTHLSWSVWRDDAFRAAAWLEERLHLKIGLWGLRLGALLAANLAAEQAMRFSRLLFWQPVLDGKMHLTQYLRQRVAALMDRGLPAETTEAMRLHLQSGGLVEVAGYQLAEQIQLDLDNKRMLDFTNLANLRIDWLEHALDMEKPLPIPVQKTSAALEAQGCEIHIQRFTGPQIWQLHDRDTIPELLEHTTRLIGSSS